MAIERPIESSMEVSIEVPITGGDVQRFFTTTDGVNQAFTFPTQTFTGDFEIEGAIATTSSSQSAVISGGTGAGGLEIIMTTGGLAEIFLAGVSVFTGVIPIDDGPLNRYTLSRTGTTASLFINDVADGSGTVSGTVTLDSINQRSGGTLFMDGVSADVVLTDAGTRSRSYAIDEDWLDDLILRDSLTVLGAGLLTGSVTLGTGWTDNLDGTFTSDGSQSSNSNLEIGITSDQNGNNVLHTFEIVNLSAGSVRALFAGNTGNGDLQSAPGTFKIIRDVSDALIRSGVQANSTFVGTVRIVATGLVEASGYGTAVNITSADAELFTQQDNGDFLSNTELWTFGDSVSSGAEGTGNAVNAGGNVLVVAQAYQTKFTSSGFTAGGMLFQYGATDGTDITTNGSFTETEIATTTALHRTVVGAVQSNSGATFSDTSTKRILEKV